MRVTLKITSESAAVLASVTSAITAVYLKQRRIVTLKMSPTAEVSRGF
jgi:hypothetical protein